MWLHKYKWGGGTYHVIRGGGGKRLGRPYSGPKGPASSGHGPSPLLTKCPLSSANQQYILPISRYTLSQTVLLISAIFFWLSPPPPPASCALLIFPFLILLPLPPDLFYLLFLYLLFSSLNSLSSTTLLSHLVLPSVLIIRIIIFVGIYIFSVYCSLKFFFSGNFCNSSPRGFSTRGVLAVNSFVLTYIPHIYLYSACPRGR